MEQALLAGASASNSFAFRLYGQVGVKPGNTFFSPASIAVALAMTDLGVGGKTREEMERVLGADAVGDLPLQEAYPALQARLATVGAGVELQVVNQLWGQVGYHFLKDFRDATKTRDGAPLEEADFARDDLQARASINRRVSELTRKRIPELLPKGVLNHLTRLVLVNAIYFKGSWEARFNKAATLEDGFFRLASGEEVTAPMMSRLGRYQYAEDAEAQWLELPYEQKEVALVVVLPKHPDGLARVEAALSAKRLDAQVSAMAEQLVSLSLPRFKLSASFDLKDTLTVLGMSRAFDDHRADFSGMTDKDGLVLSKVLHQAELVVNEEGSEAAAATAVIVRTRSVPRGIPFLADRPFLFFIRDTRSGAVLFMGKLVDPRT